MSDNELLVEIQDLRVEFFVRSGIVKAVDGVSFDIRRGQTFGVIGESGCGKSITARAILQMIPKPGKITNGQVMYHRQAKGSTQTDLINISKLDPDGRTIREIRGGEIGMIFQEPMSSLTPVYTAGVHIDEALIVAPPDGLPQGRRPVGRVNPGPPEAQQGRRSHDVD